MFFWNSMAFFDDPVDVGNLISGSSAFSKTSLNNCKFMVHILLKPGLENFQFNSVQSLSHVQLFVTPRTVTRLLCPWGFSGKNTRVVCHFFLQGIFPDQGSNLHLLHWQGDSLPLSHMGSSWSLSVALLTIPKPLTVWITTNCG